jgi:hypothetical protein
MPKTAISQARCFQTPDRPQKFGTSYPTFPRKKPHWRRGHWRHQACGVGWTQHKYIWIEPYLVHDELVLGDTAGVTMFVDNLVK